jgi:hypothetical protein
VSEIPYREESTDEWADDVIGNWTIEQKGKTVYADGTCRRCGHHTTSEYSEVDSVRSDAKEVQVIISCRCGEPHDGRPDGRVGCGAAAPFIFELD